MLDNWALRRRSKRLLSIERELLELSQSGKKIRAKAQALQQEYEAIKVEVKRLRKGQEL